MLPGSFTAHLTPFASAFLRLDGSIATLHSLCLWHSGTMLTCSLLKCVDVVHYPEASKESFKDIMPLPVLFLANALTGLSGTKRVNLPMFTVLRRFSIFFTMVLEWRILRSAASPRVQVLRSCPHSPRGTSEGVSAPQSPSRRGMVPETH